MEVDEALHLLQTRVGIVFGDRPLTAEDKAEVRTWREYQDWLKAKEREKR